MTQSVEPQIADLVNGWLKQYKLKYYIEQDAPNEEIKNALHEYESKQVGSNIYMIVLHVKSHCPVLVMTRVDV